MGFALWNSSHHHKDGGSQFESTIFKSLEKPIGSKKAVLLLTATNGMVECWHQSLKTSLMCHEKNDWLGKPPFIVRRLRTTLNDDVGSSAVELFLEQLSMYLDTFFTTPTILRIRLASLNIYHLS